MKKLVICLLIAAVVIGIAAAWFVSTPEFMLLQLAGDVKKDGVAAIEPYLADNLKPIFQTAMKISTHPWVTGLLSSDATQDLLSLMSAEGGSMSLKLEDIRKGSSTASCLIGVDASAFTAQIDIELIRQDGDWLISGFTLPSLSLK